ncbi:MAG: hypothetical protein WBC40_04855 [Halobacteriota archaeon]
MSKKKKVKKDETVGDKDMMEFIPADKDYVRRIIREGRGIHIVIRRFLEWIEMDQFKPGEMIKLSYEVFCNSLFIELPENRGGLIKEIRRKGIEK